MTMTRRLRVRHAGGSTTIELHPGGSTAGDVANLIESAVGIPKTEQAWKAGFPPRPAPKTKADDPFPPADVDLVHVTKADAAGGATVDFTAPSTGDSAETNNNAIAAEVDASAAVDEPPRTDPDGFVVRRVIDADNSCLFNSVGYALRRSRTDAPALRRLIADAVLADPHTYTEAFLGRSPAEYAEWITRPSSWGGQIELSIFSRMFRTEIAAFDVIRDRHDVYGTEEDYKRRILAMYDGIHYDALAFCFDPSLPEEMDVTQFSPRDEVVMDRARALCSEQHRKKAFTDTSNFTLRCLVCQEGLVGQKGAAEHAEKTGHANFAEFQ